jgi:hypothetical protein
MSVRATSSLLSKNRVHDGVVSPISPGRHAEHIFEIQKNNGTPGGTIMSSGFSGGPIPPGTRAVR